jgi:hypothetical protein
MTERLLFVRDLVLVLGAVIVIVALASLVPTPPVTP